MIFHSHDSLPEGKPPFSYGFFYGFPIKTSIFLWFSYGFSRGRIRTLRSRPGLKDAQLHFGEGKVGAAQRKHRQFDTAILAETDGDGWRWMDGADGYNIYLYLWSIVVNNG